MPTIDQPTLDIVISICLGLGLSAACGFRVFVPLLGLSVAAMSGYVQPAAGWEWVGSWPAVACLATATVLEIAAYYVPWIDNALDSIATPAAVIAGTLATASVVTDLPPLWRWSLAAIAGGGIAGLIQAATVTLRGTSTVTTGGLANFLVSTGELILSLVTTLVALLLPVLGAGLVLALLLWITLKLTNRRAKVPPSARPAL
ncbi:MAG TPA: DUF4126 domain-containing protein [Pirellulaceae bacterium]|nr:DUF4126 domain-containing protein [Pirellulaceae bacterium]